MLGFHDANEVKTWQCVWQPPHSSCSAASFSSGSQSDPPVAFIQRSLLCPGMSPIAPAGEGMWGVGVIWDKSQGRVQPQITHNPLPIFSKLKLLLYQLPTTLPPLTIAHGQRRTYPHSGPLL